MDRRARARAVSSILGRDARQASIRRQPTSRGAPVSAEFNWWLLILGIVVGAVLTWLVLADSNRRDQEQAEAELAAEAGWIARSLGRPQVDAEIAEEILRAHRRYLGFPPPDALVDPAELVPAAEPSDPTP
jgi:hypothetical protein